MGENKAKLILYQKWEDFTNYMYECVLKCIPSNERYTLGSDIRNILWDTNEKIICVASKLGDRAELLKRIDVNIQNLFSMIRLGIRIKAIPNKRYEPIAVMLTEIGRITGGLIKKAS